MIYQAWTASFHEATPHTVLKAHNLLTSLGLVPTAFNGWETMCEEKCGECTKCLRVKKRISAEVLKPDARVWEVWSEEAPAGTSAIAFIGILRLSRIQAGTDAVADFAFFDGKLQDKSSLITSWIENAFSDHDDWTALKRITAEAPAHAFALIRFLQGLGFGGQFPFAFKGLKAKVEGAKRAAVPYRGEWSDLLLMGKVR